MDLSIRTIELRITEGETVKINLEVQPMVPIEGFENDVPIIGSLKR